MIKISHSRVSCFLTCPYQHYLRYVEKLQKKGKSRPLSFGSDFHKLLEMRGDKKLLDKAVDEIRDSYYDLNERQQADLGEDYLENLHDIFQDYQTVYKDEVIPDSTEKVFDIPLGKYKGEPVVFTGIIDELYKTDEGLVIGEHKTFSRKPDLLFIAMNTQKCLYAKAVETITGKMPVRVQWDYIKSTPAAEPVWLEKSQRFSEAKSTSVTNLSWLRACKRYDITDESILSKADKYAGNLPNFFFRLTEDYIPEMVNDIFDGFKYTAKMICRTAEKNKCKHTGQACSWCDFRDICYAELAGGNRAYIIERDFEERKKR